MEALQRLHNRGSIGGYDIENSVKLQEAGVNTEFFNYTVSTTGNRKTGTISMWIKRTEVGVLHYIFEMGGTDNDTDRLHCRFNSSDTLNLATGSTNWRVTNRVFRDTSAWYHLVVAVDTTQATASDRVKIYINGVEETSFSTSNNPSQNGNTGLAYQKQIIGFSEIDNTGGLDGYLADVCVVDGQQLAASDFGEFDTDTGIWKPKNLSSISVGTNGSLMKFENAASMGANSASAGHGFSVQNINQNDQATDTPTNNFATNNPLAQNDMNPLQGATQWTHNNASDWESSISTIGVTQGKWYFEASMDSTGNFIGIIANNGITSSYNCMDTYIGDRLDTQNAGIGYHGAGNIFQNDSFTSGVPSYGGGNIISCALDMDNGYVYFAKDGSWINSGDPTSGASGTGGWAVYDTSDIQFFATSIYSTSDNIKCNWGGFRIYSISSAETDANGYGTFEYAPPSGYYALCTKNLAEFG